MAQQKAHPVVRFLVAFLIVIAVAAVAFFVGYLIGDAAGLTRSAGRVSSGTSSRRSVSGEEGP